MMTDRELLEAAAKAAGFSIVRCRLDDPMWNDMLLPAVNGIGVGWNPLTSDGDALRLAVQLHINIRYVWDGCNDQYDPVYAERGNISAEEQIGLFRHEQIDEADATRRAIVRAAAEIGRAG